MRKTVDTLRHRGRAGAGTRIAELVVFVGPSGCGSTLLRLISAYRAAEWRRRAPKRLNKGMNRFSHVIPPPADQLADRGTGSGGRESGFSVSRKRRSRFVNHDYIEKQ